MKKPRRQNKEQLGKVSSRINWDCSQIEDREEGEDVDWHEGDQMEEQ